ncbi:MAG: arsenate reductase (glutaredoxin) [Flavobacteriaceae bacterium]|nr:arsenate reductase (glutaredoxin) [Flavobacteriaceae bacterium]
MVTIYHNPRCRKSREGLQLVEASGVPHEVRLYLKEPLTKNELQAVLKALGIPAEDLVRKNEAIWKSEYKGRPLSEADIISAMQAKPTLVERPIVSDGKRAVIGRPGEKITEFLSSL